MYNGNNPIAIQSQTLITNALLSCMKKKSFSKIQIKELCQEAQVSRQTFYSLFDSKEQVIERYFDQIFSEFQTELRDREILSLSIICSSAIRHFMDNSNFIELLVNNKLDYILNRKLEQYLLEFSKTVNVAKPQNHEYAIAFLAGALVGMIRKYIENKEFKNDKVISDLIERIITGQYFVVY